MSLRALVLELRELQDAIFVGGGGTAGPEPGNMYRVEPLALGGVDSEGQTGAGKPSKPRKLAAKLGVKNGRKGRS